MAKTALQLLNEVGKNLRRSTGSTYTTLTQNADAIFIMQAINEAKRMVEDAWKWSVLQTEITFSSVGDTAAYDLSQTAIVTSADTTVTIDRSEEVEDFAGRLQAWDVTDSIGFRLSKVSKSWAEGIRNNSTQSIEKPDRVAIYPNGNGLTVLFPYAPAGVRNYKFIIKNPQEDLASASTTLLVPWQPVVLAATAIAFDERGEELGGDSNRWWERYENAFGSALARDSEASDFMLVSDTNYDAGYWKN